MKKIIIDEVMHLHATSDSSVKSQEESKTRLFSHFLLWAPFAVSGPGTQVHPSALVEKQPKKTKKRDERPSFINSLFFKQKIHIADSSANNHKPMGLVDISDGDLRREAKILRSEGGVELADAAEAELRRRRQAKVDEVKRRCEIVHLET